MVKEKKVFSKFWWWNMVILLNKIRPADDYVVIGYLNISVVRCDVWLIKTDGLGNEEWNKSNERSLYGSSCSSNPSCGHINCGRTKNYIIVIKKYLVNQDRFTRK